MTQIRCVRYTQNEQPIWDNLVDTSRNGTFLLNRSYMDYHAHRFTDHSLLIYNNNELIALLPANQQNQQLISHQGLTYGGLILSPNCKGEQVLDIFKQIILYMQQNALLTLIYKPIPHIYHKYISEDDLYALHQVGAQLTSRAISSTLHPYAHPTQTTQRKRSIKRGEKEALQLEHGEDLATFWRILTHTLNNRHNVDPVHSISEMELLQQKFPQNIKLHTILKNGELLAGVVVYKSDVCAHLQYIATTPQGREVGALDYLISQLIDTTYGNIQNFDFGISTESGGAVLNSGLLSQKEGFGARAVVYDTYKLEVNI